MINLKNYFVDMIYRLKTSPNCDLDFWENLRLIDIEESDEHVRYCFAIYEPIN